MTLAQLNRLPPEEAYAAFERCCGAKCWINAMVGSRPFESEAALLDTAERAANTLAPGDWREAFAHHPKIGDVNALREKFANTAAWASGEQAGAAAADESTLAALAEGNREYETRFGYIFIVCATGKSAAEILALLRARLPNEPRAELAIAAGEQRKITALRLAKLIGEAE